MNVYILTDMEGVSLVTEWEQVQQGHPFYPKYQQVLTDEVNAAVEGALAAGAERIVINDGHGSKDYNLLWDRLNRKAEIERPDSATNILPSLQKDFAAMILIGYHSMEGTPDAVLAHTQSHTNIRYYEVNGQRFGEIAQMSLIAGHFGVPVAYMSGDRAAVAEARSFLGDDLPATVVKWGHANGKAVSLHPEASVYCPRTVSGDDLLQERGIGRPEGEKSGCAADRRFYRLQNRIIRERYFVLMPFLS
ncbi:MAG: D-aminopeptidase dipeptide-binding protein DppA [Paenibacillus sp.]|nr:D-aminopeptidase dipeptide-binding protein DppA [Paenibacillus sp.]